MNEFMQFTALPGVISSHGATKADFAAFEAQTGLTLPSEVRQLYANADGLTIDRGNRMRIHALEEVANYVESFRQCGIPSVWGYFPFTDRNDSNPHCVCCSGPVAGYVVRVNHDDIARIEHRSLASFFENIRRVLEVPAQTRNENNNEPSLWNLPQDLYPNTSNRTPEDVETARQLLAFADALEEGTAERADAERWAITLFSENEVAEIARLLDVGDEYRREEALVKLSSMKIPAAREAIQKHNREEREFTRQVVDALKQTGLNVEVINGQPRIEPGRIALNTELFFTHRRRPTILVDVVQRVRELIAYKTQRNT